MKADEKRNGRINHLYQKALTGKFTWGNLLDMCRSMGVAESTAKSYLDDVEAKLKKFGHLK